MGRRVADRVERSAADRVSLSYITAKIHGSDAAGQVEAGSFGDGDALFLYQEYDGIAYETLQVLVVGGVDALQGVAADHRAAHGLLGHAQALPLGDFRRLPDGGAMKRQSGAGALAALALTCVFGATLLLSLMPPTVRSIRRRLSSS